MHKSLRHKAVPPTPELYRKMQYHLHPVVVKLSDRTVKFDAVRLMVGGGGLSPGQPCPAQFFARSPAQRAKRRARNGRK